MSSSIFDFRQQRVQWSKFLKQVRAHFDSLNYTEVTTPYLVPAGAFESTIDTLKVSFSTGTSELHSSPEMEMKSILAEFPQSIYQICKSFRDDPDSPCHAKEFTMLEFYKPNSSCESLEKETLALFQSLAEKKIPTQSLSIYTLVQQLTGIELDKNKTQVSLLKSVQANTELHATEKDSWADLFFKIMIDIVEPSLPKNTFCLINRYPIEVSPLSQPIPGTTQAERFEIYWNGIELCNGCAELSDEELLRKRYQTESRSREESGKKPHPEPTQLFHSASNLKGVSGVAVGLERLFFAINSLNTI